MGKTDHKQTRQHHSGSQGEILDQQHLGDGEMHVFKFQARPESEIGITNPAGDSHVHSVWEPLCSRVVRSYGEKDSVQSRCCWYQQTLKRWSGYTLDSGAAQIQMAVLPLWTVSPSSRSLNLSVSWFSYWTMELLIVPMWQTCEDERNWWIWKCSDPDT